MIRPRGQASSLLCPPPRLAVVQTRQAGVSKQAMKAVEETVSTVSGTGRETPAGWPHLTRLPRPCARSE